MCPCGSTAIWPRIGSQRAWWTLDDSRSFRLRPRAAPRRRGTLVRTGFSKLFNFINTSWYIHGLSKALRKFLTHCPECQVSQTRRHRPYSSPQPIESPSVQFYTISLDFVLVMPVSAGIEAFDCILSVTCNYLEKKSL